jgi:hypothetical protein
MKCPHCKQSFDEAVPKTHLSNAKYADVGGPYCGMTGKRLVSITLADVDCGQCLRQWKQLENRNIKRQAQDGMRKYR